MTLSAAQSAALREVELVWPGRASVIIGATALGLYYEMSWRKTADVDLVIAIALDEFPGPLAERAGWKQHPQNEHQFESPQGPRLDILPAVDAFLQGVGDPESAAHASMQQRGPARWTAEEKPLLRRLQALRSGIDSVMKSTSPRQATK